MGLKIDENFKMPRKMFFSIETAAFYLLLPCFESKREFGWKD